MKIRVAYASLIGGIALIVIVACGSRSEGLHPSSSAASPSHSACWQGNVTLGSAPGAIDFTAQCASVRPNETFVLILTRSLPADPRGGPGIHAFRKFPPISGPGAIGLHGRCHLGGYTLVCQGRFHGRFELHGRIWVRPQTRCSTNVALALHESPGNCSGKQGCFAVFITRPLIEGLPGGC